MRGRLGLQQLQTTVSADPWVIGWRGIAWTCALLYAHQYLLLLALAGGSSEVSSAPVRGANHAPSTRLRDLTAWWPQPLPLPLPAAATNDDEQRLTAGVVPLLPQPTPPIASLAPHWLSGGAHRGHLGGPAAASALWRRPPARKLIQNGQLASISRYPYVAVVARPDGSYLCAGSLIHPRLVVTAGHCVSPSVGGTINPLVYLGLDRLQQIQGDGLGMPGAGGASGGSRIAAAAAAGASKLNSGSAGSGAALVSALAALVGLGSTGGLAAGPALASRSIPHPRYNPGIFDFDVAVLVLAEDAPSGARAVRLPQQDQSLAPSPRLTVLGWGATEENTLSSALRQGGVTPLETDVCRGLFRPYGTGITKRMLCTTGITCAGDSGGPLILSSRSEGDDGGDSEEDVLVGQVSFGFPRRKGFGCPQPNPATVFSNLRNPDVNAWLRSQIAQQHQQLADLTITDSGAATSDALTPGR